MDMLARSAPTGSSLYVFANGVTGDLWLNQLDYNFALIQQEASVLTDLPVELGGLQLNADGSGAVGSLSWDAAGDLTASGATTIAGLPFTVMSAQDPTHSSIAVRPDGFIGITTWPTGNALDLEEDGGGALGCPPNQLTWGPTGEWKFTGAGYLSTPLVKLSDVSVSAPAVGQVLAWNGTNWYNANADFGGGGGGVGTLDAPFTVVDALNGHPLFQVMPTAAGGRVVSVGPGEVGPGAIVLTVSGDTNADALDVATAEHTERGFWAAQFLGAGWDYGDPAIPPTFTGPVPGTVNGVHIRAGTDGTDYALLVEDDGNGGLRPPTPLMHIAGDGSGSIGVAPSQLTWDANGAFSLTGSATMGGLAQANVTNPMSGQVLTWDGTAWINANPSGGGGGGAGSIGQLSDVSIANQHQGQVLSWNGTQWVNTTLSGISDLLAPVWIRAKTAETQDTYTLRVDGPLEPNRSTVVIYRPARTLQNQWDMQIGSGLAMAGSPSGSSLGCSNGLNIAAGTNNADYSIRVQNDAGTCTFFAVKGDGSGAITDCNGNGLQWGTTGNFSMVGTGTINLGFETLANVNVTNPQNGQTIVYNSSTQQWVNSSNIPQITTLSLTLAPGGTLTGVGLVNLNDTSLVHISDGQVLTFDALSNKWVAAFMPLERLSDASGIAPTLGQVLTWDGTYWTPVTPLGGEAALSGLADVTLTSATAGDFLIYNGTDWVNSKTTQFGTIHGSLTVAGAFGASGQISLPTDYHGWVGPYLAAIAWDPQGNFTLQSNPGGGTFTLAQDPQAPLQAATKQYVDNAIIASPKALSELTDVSLTNLQNLQVLGYDSLSQRWVNATLPGGAEIDSLATLIDVNLNLPVGNGQALVYSTATQRWQNTPITNALAQLTDVSVSGQSQGQVLAWSQTTSRWVNINSVNPVQLSNPQNGQVLTYNGTNWVNLAPAFSPQFGTLATGQAIVWNGSNWVNAPSVYPVSLSSPQNGQVLSYNGTNWTNTTPVSVTVADTPPANPQAGWLWWDSVGGQMYVRFGTQWVVANPTGAFGLGNLTDTTITSATAGQVLSYNGTRWVNAAQALASLSDVALATPADGQALVYDATSQRWVNSRALVGNYSIWAPSGTPLALSSATNSTLLVASDGTVNTSLSTAGGQMLFGTVSNTGMNLQTNGNARLGISNVGNVVVSAPSSGSVLTLNGTAGSVPLDIQNAANATVTSYAMRVNTGPRGDCFFIRGDGTLQALPNPTGPVFVINQLPVASGNAIVDINPRDNNGTGGGNTLRVWSGVNANSVYLQGAAHTTSGYSVLTVVGQGTASNDGGIKIQAGTNGNDYAISARTAGASVIFEGRGDRTFVLPGIPGAASGTYQVLQWWAGGFGSVIYTTSSGRYKRQVRSLARKRARELVAKLRTVTFHSKCSLDDPKMTCYGLIAEEVAAVDGALVCRNAKGEPDGVAYDRIAMLLLPLVQELLGMDEPEGAY